MTGRIVLPEKVIYILDTLMAAGFEAYAVGGCIRDSLLDRIPDDWDITTSARPDQVKSLFRRTVDTGIAHGTVTVMLEREGFEVTTYRIDGEYKDGRHPSQVTFTPSLSEDLKRRDFTINAMAYNEAGGLVDLFGGTEDMEKKRIRCVGDARQRFTEDGLRIMRAVRFSAQLGYEIEGQTGEAVKELAYSLNQISGERIQTELVKLVTSPHPDYLRKAIDMGVTKVIMPELDKAMETDQNHPHHCYTVGEHILHSMVEIRPEKALRLAMLFHDIGKPCCLTIDDNGVTHFHCHGEHSARIAEDILKRLKFDNDTIRTVCRLVQYHDYGNGVEPDRTKVRRAVHKIGEEYFRDLLAVKKADILAQSGCFRQEKLDLLGRWEAVYESIMQERECVSLKTLAVTGADLIEWGMKPGPQMGETLNRLLELVLEHPEFNTKEYLLKNLN